jgi:hypothetical protein
MSSDFAIDVSIVSVDVTPTADMAAFSLERLRKLMPLQVNLIADGDGLALGPTVSSGDNASKLTSFDFMVHYCYRVGFYHAETAFQYKQSC